jgi:general secretion pathway protein G
MMYKTKKNNKGFTLIELMVVLVILGILAGLIVPRMMGRTEDAKRVKTRLQIDGLGAALKLYKLDNGVYPTTEQGLEALVASPKTGTPPRAWREGGYLEKEKNPFDGWGNPLSTSSRGSGEYDLSFQWGDGEPGGEGKNQDVNSWEDE